MRGGARAHNMEKSIESFFTIEGGWQDGGTRPPKEWLVPTQTASARTHACLSSSVSASQDEVVPEGDEIYHIINIPLKGVFV